MRQSNLLSVIISIVALAISSTILLLNLTTKEKVAYVDSMKLLSEYDGVKDVRAELEKRTKGWQANIDTLESDFKGDLKKYEDQRSTLNDKEKRQREESLQNKQQQYQQYRTAMENKAKEENEKLSARPLQRLNDFIKEYGKKHNYKIIFGANQSGNILYTVDGLDITGEVLEGANADYKKNK